MSASAPDPSRLILLAALGIGTYWFLTRRQAMAAPAAGQGVQTPYRANNTANLVAQGVGALARLLNGGTTPGTVDGRASQQWDTTPTYGQPGTAYNNPSAYTAPASSSVDGFPYNPVQGSVYESYPDYGSSTGDDGAWL